AGCTTARSNPGSSVASISTRRLRSRNRCASASASTTRSSMAAASADAGRSRDSGPGPEAPTTRRRVATIVGARPQFVKAAALSPALAGAGLDEALVHTGQHYDREMSRVFFDGLAL